MLTQALLPHLRALQSAQVIFIGSALGRIGLPGYSVYSATKFGLRGFAQALRRELADSGVRVQYLGPRSTRTAFNTPRVEAYNRVTGTAMDSPGLVAQALLRMVRRRDRRTLSRVARGARRAHQRAAPGLLDGAFAKHRPGLPDAAWPRVLDPPEHRGRSRMHIRPLKLLHPPSAAPLCVAACSGGSSAPPAHAGTCRRCGAPPSSTNGKSFATRPRRRARQALRGTCGQGAQGQRGLSRPREPLVWEGIIVSS